MLPHVVDDQVAAPEHRAQRERPGKARVGLSTCGWLNLGRIRRNEKKIRGAMTDAAPRRHSTAMAMGPLQAATKIEQHHVGRYDAAAAMALPPSRAVRTSWPPAPIGRRAPRRDPRNRRSIRLGVRLSPPSTPSQLPWTCSSTAGRRTKAVRSRADQVSAREGMPWRAAVAGVARRATVSGARRSLVVDSLISGGSERST